MSRKSFNRLFDFNGDGKTTWNEVWLAKKIWEEVDQTKEPHAYKPISYVPGNHNSQPDASRKTKQPIMGRMNEEVQPKQTFTVPENQEMEALTFEEYKKSRKNVRSDILKSLLATAAMLSLAGLLAWKGIALCSSEYGSVLRLNLSRVISAIEYEYHNDSDLTEVIY